MQLLRRYRAGVTVSQSQGHHCNGGPFFRLAGLAFLAAICLSACYVVPRQNRSDVSAISIHPFSVMGIHALVVASELPGTVPVGSVRAVSRCNSGTGAQRVEVEILSYGDDRASWCEDDGLARSFAAVREEIRRYTGFDPRVRRLSLRLVPPGMRYRRTRWSLGRNNLKLDFAVDAAPPAEGGQALDMPAAYSELIRNLAHEVFHIAVRFSGRRFPHDFSTRFASELAASLVEPCVELSILGKTRGGVYEGRSKFVAGGYVGADEQLPTSVYPQTPFVASIIASIRAEKLLDDITGERLIARDSPEAEKIFSTCRKYVQDYLSLGSAGKDARTT